MIAIQIVKQAKLLVRTTFNRNRLTGQCKISFFPSIIGMQNVAFSCLNLTRPLHLGSKADVWNFIIVPLFFDTIISQTLPFDIS